MSTYGAQYLQFAPFKADKEEPSAALPLYGTPVNLGELMKVTDSPTYNKASIAGDNKTVDSVCEFKEAGIDVEITELSNENAKIVLGATILAGDTADLEFGGSDIAPFGGMAFFVNKTIHKMPKFQGIYYPKIAAEMQGEEFTTKGESISLKGSKVKFTAYEPNYGKWKIKSPLLDTEADAKAWVDGKIKEDTTKTETVSEG